MQMHSPEFTPVMIAFIVVALAMGITSFVCWLIVTIKIFKESVGLGILSLFVSLFTFIYGWVKVNEYQIKRTMIIWTLVIVLMVVLGIVGMALAFHMMPMPQNIQPPVQ